MILTWGAFNTEVFIVPVALLQVSFSETKTRIPVKISHQSVKRQR